MTESLVLATFFHCILVPPSLYLYGEVIFIFSSSMVLSLHLTIKMMEQDT